MLDKRSKDQQMTAVFVSTFPPRRCGLAAFTEDLLRSMNGLGIMPEAKVIAVSNDGASYRYDPRVLLEIRQNTRDSYRKAAERLKGDGDSVVSLQHEFGIFGGQYGGYVLDFLDAAPRPVVTTFHTVLPAPTTAQRQVVQEIASRSAKVVVMANRGKDILASRYGIPEGSIEVVPHGVPTEPPTTDDRSLLKELYGFGDKKVISTFGLLSPGKGVENVIRAMPKVVSRHRDAVYLILGQTHPVVRDLYGESYRDKLVQMASALGVKDEVVFVGHYLTRQEVVDYLALTDVYVTPYTNPDQICSGTLAYAVSAGKAIVSTPYLYALEVLGDGRGVITPIDDSEALAGALVELFDDDAKRHALEAAAREYGKSMAWPAVAGSYARIFAEVLGDA